ncbi:MAG: carbon monoxide dehydrogenase subunit G [Acidiferrobacterales bacterium]|nr:carbon monoxide dehydrogenase subunit G [Acidiferrobacterales bacterium]
MEISGSRVLPVERARVWRSLHDADLIRDSLSGCESLQWISDDELEGVITLKFSAIKARMQIRMTISDAVEQEGYRITGSANARALGFAKAEATIRLEDVADGCELFYGAQVKIGGKIAQIGSRLMTGMSTKIIDEFFDAFVAGMSEDSTRQ